MPSFIPQNLTEIEAVTECTFACICHTVLCMFSCLQINCQPFYLHQLLKFHPLDWLIEIYLQTEGQGTHHKMASLQPMPVLPSVSGILAFTCLWGIIFLVKLHWIYHLALDLPAMDILFFFQSWSFDRAAVWLLVGIVIWALLSSSQHISCSKWLIKW